MEVADTLAARACILGSIAIYPHEWRTLPVQSRSLSLAVNPRARLRLNDSM